MDARVRDQVSLEFTHVDVEGTIETEGSCEGRNNLACHGIQVLVGRLVNAEVVVANAVHSFVIQGEGNIAVLQQGMGRQDCVVRFND